MKMYLIISIFFVLLGASCKTDNSMNTSANHDLKTPANGQETIEPNQVKLDVQKNVDTLSKAGETKNEVKSIVDITPVKKAEIKVQPTTKKIEKTEETTPKKKAIKKTPPKPIDKPKPIIFFPDTVFNYGFIDEGDTIRHSFRFLNDGTVPLEILDVQVSCGCTIPEYSLTDIGPGRLSKIGITFLSKGKLGPHEATIDVVTNASKPRQTLYLKGVIR